MFDYRPKHLMNIAGSNIIDAIMEDAVDEADVYFVNHQTLRSYMVSTNGYQLHKFFKKINVGSLVSSQHHLPHRSMEQISMSFLQDLCIYLTTSK